MIVEVLSLKLCDTFAQLFWEIALCFIPLSFCSLGSNQKRTDSQIAYKNKAASLFNSYPIYSIHV